MAFNQKTFEEEYDERKKKGLQYSEQEEPAWKKYAKYGKENKVNTEQEEPAWKKYAKFANKPKSSTQWTSGDLYNLAIQSGLQPQADQILAQKGEEANQIFSGGWISDIFDVLNALQYGVTGMLKGKSFMEGVKNRESFSSKDALGEYGIPGMIGGMLLDIAVDPLTYIAPWTVLKKVPGVVKGLNAVKEGLLGKVVTKTIQETPELENGVDVLKKVSNAVPEIQRTYQTVEGGTKIGRWFADRFVYRFGQDPNFSLLDDRRIKNMGVGVRNVMETPANMLNLKDDVASLALKVGKDGRPARVSNDILQEMVNKGKLTQDQFNIISKANNSIDNFGNQLVDLGVLSKEKYEENINEYIHAFYKEHLIKEPSGFGFKKVGIRGTKKRVEGLTPEKMEELGQIKNPAYLYLRTQIEMIKDIENAKLFKEVAKNFGSNVEQVGFKMLPDTRRLGDLAGKWVPEHMYNAIQEITKPVEQTIGNKIIGAFKYAKVVLNPATHARNVMSNQVLNWWKLGMNPLDPRTLNAQREALVEIAKGGGKWTDIAKPLGYNLNTFAANELNNLLESPEGIKALGNKAGQLTKKIGNVYQGEENFAKLTAFIFNSKYGGMAAEDAWKAAETATFNYAQVTPFVRQLRTSLWGYPFITFPLKATPIAVETIAKHPARVSVFGKIKQSLENQADITETAEERASEPEWIRDGFYIKLPIKDSEGRSAYFDLTYIIPLGDIISGQLFTRQVSRETGLPESVPETAVSVSPVLNLIKDLTKNQDFYGNKIWKESDTTDKQLKDLFGYVTKTFMPTPIAEQIPSGYKTTGEKQKGRIQRLLTPKEEPDQQRTTMEEMLRNVGLKIQPIDKDIQETYMEWEKRKALQQLLIESGIMSQFTTPYVPKNK